MKTDIASLVLFKKHSVKTERTTQQYPDKDAVT